MTSVPAPSDSPVSDLLLDPSPDASRPGRVARGDAGILIADDSPVARRFAAKLLRDHGYRVEVALDGFDALGMVFAVNPDLLLLDSGMPRLDGFQTCALVKRAPGFADLPVIILSDCGGLYARVRAHLVGARSCLSRPFTADELLNAVAGALCDV
ncbi:twitching motility two-component system response regulator PilG [Thiocapsa rosea]|uniref:Twitching motility two-component system response regulator PilG n=2 Tax=Thiocapsa rosea TaxID=69360 RepID=A0A495V4U7_9GAMM|nr:twitching motility two-component system response regulator PilG [Thiocapsa rosea]